MTNKDVFYNNTDFIRRFRFHGRYPLLSSEMFEFIMIYCKYKLQIIFILVNLSKANFNRFIISSKTRNTMFFIKSNKIINYQPLYMN